MLLISHIGYAYSIGTQEILFTILNSDRILVAEIYYPTAKVSKSKTIKHGIWERKAFLKDAPSLFNKCLLPLVIFSHGFRGDRFGNSWIAESLVSKGYIVAAIDHTHNVCYGKLEVQIIVNINSLRSNQRYIKPHT